MRNLKSGGEDRLLRRFLLGVLVAAVIGAVDATAHRMYAQQDTCYNDPCKAGSDAWCRDLGCDFCDDNETCGENSGS
jgi:hypothetical protein